MSTSIVPPEYFVKYKVQVRNSPSHRYADSRAGACRYHKSSCGTSVDQVRLASLSCLPSPGRVRGLGKIHGPPPRRVARGVLASPCAPPSVLGLVAERPIPE